MQNKNKMALMAISFIISALGVSAGTFAWFDVVDLTGATVSGTIRGEGDTLQVGFRLSEVLSEAERNRYNFTPDTHNIPGDGFIYWTDTEIEPETFAFIYAREGFSIDNTVQPITSGSFESGDPISLYERSTSSYSSLSRIRPIDEIANKLHYVAFTLLFRMAHVSAENPLDDSEGVAGYNIYLDYGMRFIGSQNVTDALRMGIETSEMTDIISPGAKIPGTIDVGGRMDFNGDGYYDFARGTIDSGTYYEIGYGEFVNELTDANWGSPSGIVIPPHKDNDYFFEAVSNSEASPLINATPKTAIYSPISKHYPLGIPLATTNELGVAEMKITIWLEGWDHACTNQIASAKFGADLKFVSQK